MTGGEGLLKRGDMLLETYQIEALIGVGGTGEVYRAQNTASHRAVAIKILKQAFASDEKFLNLMRRELLRDVNHDAVVKYFDLLRTQEYGGLHFLVMELIEGPSLAALMAKGPVPADQLLRIAARIAAGLRAAHGAGVFHRDLSPDNVLLRDGDPDRATLIDFGVAKDLRPDARTVIGEGFAGKYEYAAPEQMDGNADGQSDIYSVGATLLAAARGATPRLPGDLFAIRRKKEEPTDVSDQPEPLRGLLTRMLAPDRARRFASAVELAQAIESAGRLPPPLPATVVAPGPSALSPATLRAAAAQGGAEPRPPAPRAGTAAEAREADAPSRRRGPWWPIALAGALAAAVAAFFAVGPGMDLLRPQAPMVDIYRLSASNEDGVRLSGNAPDAESAAALRVAAARSAPDGVVEGGVEIARGAPGEGWAPGLAQLIADLTALESWRLDVVEGRGALRGVAEDEQTASATATAAALAAELAGIDLDIDVAARAPRIDPATLAAQIEEILTAYRACGTLALEGGEAALAGAAPLVVRGRVTDAAALAELEASLRRLLGERAVTLDVDPLNRFVCRMIALLPATSAAPLEIRYSEGADGAAMAGDGFAPDATPVIDVVAPADLRSRLHVFVVDNDGGVAHLLPHSDRPASDLGEIGVVEGDRRTVRAAFPQADAAPDRLMLGFTEPYGINLVVAIAAPDHLYSPQRHWLENIEDFAPEFAGALAAARSAGAPVSVSWRLMTVETGR